MFLKKNNKEKKQNSLKLILKEMKKQAPEFKKKHLTRQITKTFNNKTWNNCIYTKISC